MKKPIDVKDLQRLVAAIDAKIAAAPKYEARDYDSTKLFWASMDAILDQLREEEGATTSKGRTVSLKLAGIRATCTAGANGVLRNWQVAARREIGWAALS